MFGLKEADVATAVRAVAGADLDRDGISERFARAAWTGIAEPGDRMAGLVVGTLGAAEALALVLTDAGTVVLHDRLRAAGVESLAPEDLGKALARWQPRADPSGALFAMRQAVRFGARLLTPDDPGWPSSLDDLELHAPVALWTRGVAEALDALPASIALVGARAATGYGEHVTMEASAGLVDRGFAIVSGAAYGIDGMAHRAALASNGITIAFLAGGVDRFYPAGHDSLLARIVESGAVVSELPCGEPPTKWRFLQRNRLIAASSAATVVLEAGWRSGSLNTAGHASTLGRPLGAVPGPVTSAASAGCHRLIREFDAVCVTNADEMAELVPRTPVDELTFPATGRTSDETRVLDALSARAPRNAGDIAARAGLAITTVQSVLGRLELEGVTSERERGWIRSPSR
ncbi:DNA-processing protein DprA [Glaciihabitans sp. dw_435]|uniref:DNA-processing protein DprA n=1 Tax=Glaciihabitans sp. dw_435 TaxID=2720081 RepID=UPI001C4A7179|nr:DNA-processing protein DprA [Glaciihabitans sp. dw_435]